MLNNLLRLDEDRILVEQLRLLLGNVASALIPTLFLSILLVLTLSNDGNSLALRIWGVTLMSYKLIATFHARRHLASEIPFEQAHRLVWTLIVLNGLDGAIWGALAWITLDTSTVVGSILVYLDHSGNGGQFHVQTLSRAAGIHGIRCDHAASPGLKSLAVGRPCL